MLMKGVLNPFQYGLFSIRLLINKVVRRLLPFCLLGMLVGSAVLSSYHPGFMIFLVLQIAFYAFAVSSRMLQGILRHFRLVDRIANGSYYFCVGNYGTLLGVFDFAARRQVTKWDPVKLDKQQGV